MYSFVAKEIDYANYFQTVSVHKDETMQSLFASRGAGRKECGHSLEHVTGKTVLPVNESHLLFLCMASIPTPARKNLNLTYEGYCDT